MRLTIYLFIANVVMFVVQFISPVITEALALTPSVALSGSFWQFITYTFLHANPWHIFINMFIFLIFGMAVEDALGPKKFLTLYFVSGIGSALFWMLLTMGTFDIPLIGASGAVFGVVTAYGFLFPKNWILIVFVPVPAMFAIVILAAMEVFFGVFGLQEGVANFGHLGGMITGLILMSIWKYMKGKTPVEDRTFEFIWE